MPRPSSVAPSARLRRACAAPMLALGLAACGAAGPEPIAASPFFEALDLERDRPRWSAESGAAPAGKGSSSARSQMELEHGKSWHWEFPGGDEALRAGLMDALYLHLRAELERHGLQIRRSTRWTGIPGWEIRYRSGGIRGEIRAHSAVTAGSGVVIRAAVHEEAD